MHGAWCPEDILHWDWDLALQPEPRVPFGGWAEVLCRRKRTGWEWEGAKGLGLF